MMKDILVECLNRNDIQSVMTSVMYHPQHELSEKSEETCNLLTSTFTMNIFTHISEYMRRDGTDH